MGADDQPLTKGDANKGFGVLLKTFDERLAALEARLIAAIESIKDQKKKSPGDIF